MFLQRILAYLNDWSRPSPKGRGGGGGEKKKKKKKIEGIKKIFLKTKIQF